MLINIVPVIEGKESSECVSIFSLSVSEKSQAIVIARLLLLSSCWPLLIKYLIIQHLLIIARCSCKARGITLKAILFELCPF